MCNKKMKWSVLMIILCFVSANAAFGWWSVSGTAGIGSNTHKNLSIEILDSISATDYPDIHKFYQPIWDATEGSADDQDAHNGDGGADDGPAEDWWNIAVLKYSYLHFGETRNGGDARTVAGAYWHIGKMLHLTEDMGVPAHAYDVYHVGWLNMGAGYIIGVGVDNLESNADTNYTSGNTYFTPPSGEEPFQYKDDLKTRTKNKLSDNPAYYGITPIVPLQMDGGCLSEPNYYYSDTKWSDFWKETNPNGTGCSSYDNGAQCKGSYGPLGNSGMSVVGCNGFARTSFGTDAENTLVKHQLADARSFGKAALQAASKSLPPIMMGFGINSSGGIIFFY